MATINRWRVWCSTDSKYEYVWADTEPTTCPVDTQHTITTSLTTIVEVLAPEAERTPDGVTRVSIEPTEGSRHTAITPNWCDKTTWYYHAAKVVGQTLVNSGDQLSYDSPTGKSWVDNYHGKYSHEDFITTDAGDVPRLKVYVDGVEKTEQDPHLGTGGDYTVDYTAGRVTFLSALDVSAVVTADVWEVGSSSWTLKPGPGKKLKIKTAEVQFSKNISIQDSVIFQAYGYVQVYAPTLWDGYSPPGPYPTNTLIPLGDPTVYKTMQDYINEANGAKPPIPKTSEPSPTWRDLTQDVITYPWEYQAVTEMRSSYGTEIRIYLEHDVEQVGELATATFYCLSYPE